MSRVCSLSSLSNEQREAMSTDLEIVIEEKDRRGGRGGRRKYGSKAPKIIYPFAVTRGGTEINGDEEVVVGEERVEEKNDLIYIPFAYDKQLPRPTRSELDTIDVPFEGKLRPHQAKVKEEAISTLNKHHSVIIAAYPGYGKCLGWNTPVMMADGRSKMVQDVVPGDKLMGDDNTSRNVLSVCRGRECMYRISNLSSSPSSSFVANESHILSLIRKSNEERDELIDISIRDYLSLPTSQQQCLYGYKTGIDLPYTPTTKSPYKIGRELAENGQTIILDEYKYNSREVWRELIRGYQEIESEVDNYVSPPGGDIRFIMQGLKERSIYPITVTKLDVGDYYGFCIDGNRRFLLSDFTVTHNTATSIYIATKVRLKTLIITHRIVLINQMKRAIAQFCPAARTQVVTAKSKKDENADFYIINAINVSKKPRSFYSGIGLLIVDEIHCILSEQLSRSLLYITPRYLVGLSATPYRNDGLNALFDLYFGTNKIIRKLKREHYAYKVRTGFQPTVEYSANGKVNWGIVLESQANDIARNELIIRIARYFPSRIFLIVTKRISQADYLLERLTELKEKVDHLTGSKQHFDPTTRILVGTNSKISVGFDFDKLDAMILAADCEAYYTQLLGRNLRRPDVVPMIFDLVDDYSVMAKHYRTRRAVYLDCGGTVKDFWKEFPDF